MNKMKFNIKEVRYRRSKFMRKSYVARKTKSRRVQTVRMIGSVGCLRHPQAYGFHHPWIALGASPLIPVKKLQHKTFSHLFSGVTLVGIKGRMLDARNSQTKLHIKFPASI
jgi:hypothetical protein